MGLQQAAVEEALPAYEQFCEVLDELDGCMATPKGAEHAELCVRALNELLASDKEEKAELVLGLLYTEGVRCHVQGQPPVMLTAVSVPAFVGLQRIWDKLLELGQDPFSQRRSHADDSFPASEPFYVGPEGTTAAGARSDVR